MPIATDQRASPLRPCPVCGGTDKCLRYLTKHPDCAFCCNPPEYLKEEGRRSYNTLFNCDFWLVRHADIGKQITIEEDEEEGPARWDEYPRAYRSLLQLTSLSPRWLDHLRQRGFTDETIQRAGYSSLPEGQAWRQLVDTLYQLYSDHWGEIPGFDWDRATRQPRIVGQGDLLIPIRDPSGEVIALQRRHYIGEPKYAWVSHRALIGTPFHHVPRDSDVLLMTEGPLKADMASQFLPYRMLSWQGVGAMTRLAPVLQAMAGIKVAYLANDMDSWLNQSVAMANLRALRAVVKYTDWQVYVLAWPVVRRELPDGKMVTEPKGIDDWLVAGAAGGQALTIEQYWDTLGPLRAGLLPYMEQWDREEA